MALPQTADPATFDHFSRHERPALLRLTHLLTGSASVGEELVQEVMLDAHRRWDELDNPSGFVRRALVNRARSHHRRVALERRHRHREAPPTVELPRDDETWAAILRCGPITVPSSCCDSTRTSRSTSSRVRETLRAVAATTPIDDIVGAIAAVDSRSGRDGGGTDVHTPATAPSAGTGLAAGFDLATASPIFAADGEPGPVAEAYLRTRFGRRQRHDRERPAPSPSCGRALDGRRGDDRRRRRVGRRP